MTATQILTIDDMGIEYGDWIDPAILDVILLGKRMFRSDAGAIPDKEIIVSTFDESEYPFLEDIGAALALQRAIICVMTSERTKPSMSEIERVVRRVESRGEMHQRLLERELEKARYTSLITSPPEDIYEYKPGTVVSLMRRALDGMKEKSYGMESLGVANSLCVTESILERINAIYFIEQEPSDGSEFQPSHFPLDIRNNLAWIAANQHASAARVDRYLAAYGTNMEDLLERVSKFQQIN